MNNAMSNENYTMSDYNIDRNITNENNTKVRRISNCNFKNITN